MNITAHSDQRKSYRYRLLDQIYRDAVSDPRKWEFTEQSMDPFISELRNGDGDVIRLAGMDGSHAFTFEQGLTSSRDVQDAGEEIK